MPASKQPRTRSTNHRSLMLSSLTLAAVSLGAFGLWACGLIPKKEPTNGAPVTAENQPAPAGDSEEVAFVPAEPSPVAVPPPAKVKTPATVHTNTLRREQKPGLQHAPRASAAAPMALSEGAQIAGGYGKKADASGKRQGHGHVVPPGLAMFDQEMNTEGYDYLPENPFKGVASDALSTFSIDVDTASYANLRRFVRGGSLPPVDAVRIEEMINYFPYAYSEPTNGRPFAVHVEVAAAPWTTEHRLVKIGLKGKSVAWGKTPASNLVFLIDVSGSMESPNKLPLLKKSLKMLVERLGEQDRVAVVVYAGASGLVLPSTAATEKQKILDVLENLTAGGSTNGGEGINLAYKIAQENFIKGGLNRVIIATDGDFNVGTTSEGALVRLIEDKAKSQVFLSVLGYGMGNYKDSTLEKLANKGNGNYAYIDSEQEARKVLVEEIGGTMMTIAKDVKIQVEFNPAAVQAYRLIGYENRVLAHEDFNNDQKDAGDIGAGHTLTAFYEVVPTGVKFDVPGVDALKYQKPAATSGAAGEMMTVKLRYKKPDEAKSNLIEHVVRDSGKKFEDASQDFRFAAAVAGVGMVLRGSKFKGSATLDTMTAIARGAVSKDDTRGYRDEFVALLKEIKMLPKPAAIN